MNLDPKEKYKLEYAEIGHLLRHYSTVRSSLTIFSLTVSLAALGNALLPSTTTGFPKFIGVFMFCVAGAFCFYFSWRCEIANQYSTILWDWFAKDDQAGPKQFINFRPLKRKVFIDMGKDPMNWLLCLALLIVSASYFLA